MKISELLDDIRKRNLVLPEFQREYVWVKEQAKQLVVSLLKGYPVGGLLFWKTDSPPDLKNIRELPEKLGTVSVILDGQQRLTTLYLLITGEIPPYYIEADIQNDPRDLYYNLETRDLQYYQVSRMRDNPLWRRVVDCLQGGAPNVFLLAQQGTQDDGTAFELAQRYNESLNALKGITSLDIPVQSVPPHASLDEAIDIFDRVNSQGTKLTDAELALTHVTGKWPTARREMKMKIDQLANRHFYFDLTFMTRALTGLVANRALFEIIHPVQRSELQKGWSFLSNILDYLLNVLPYQANIHSTEDLNTTNVLVPWVVYLANNEGRFPNEKALKNAVHWLYAAHMWARYTAQTDQRLEHDVSLVVRGEAPWDALRAEIIDQRGRIEVKPSDFEGRGVQHPLYRATYTLAKAHGAVDWFNGLALGTPFGSSYRIHSHHIFPQSALYKAGYDPDNLLHRKIINEIANRAFLTADTNLEIGDRRPEDYLAEVENRYPGALTKQFVPIDPVLWKSDRYEDFLQARREIIARKLNELMATLIAEPEKLRPRSVAELVAFGESATLEFKSTLQWDVIQNQQNKHLRQAVVKTIAGFLNSDGGTLLIGVEDRGEICGLGNDLKLLEGSTDKFGQLLTALISEYIGPEYAHLIKWRMEVVQGEQVCIVDIESSSEPAYVKGDKGKEFYVRVGNTTRLLDTAETVRYIEMKS